MVRYAKRWEACWTIRTTRREETKKEAKKTLDRLDKTRPRKVRNYELGRLGTGSRKVESIDRGGKNSYRVIKPHDEWWLLLFFIYK
jgi:hypothetical protein